MPSNRRLKPCGTTAAYMRHWRLGLRGNEIDAACREAHNRASHKSRQAGGVTDKIYAAAMWRARRDLAQLFPVEYQKLMEYYIREFRMGHAPK